MTGPLPDHETTSHDMTTGAMLVWAVTSPAQMQGQVLLPQQQLP
jgi:hypothetical protein